MYQEILDQVCQWTKEVGEFQRQALRERSFKVDSKGSSIDMVTDIDRMSEEKLVTFIQEAYPDHSILAEESGMNAKVSDYEWVIDPIDGTTNFVHGFPFHCISIGLKYKGQTVLGVVDLPVMNMIFTAIRGQGAFLNGEGIQVAKASHLGESVLCTGFPYTRKIRNPNLPIFNRIVNEVAGIRRTGSAACDLCMVAAGKVDGYWEFNLNEWDVCAGILMIEEAGGMVTRYQVGEDPLLVSGNQAIHQAILDKIDLDLEKAQ